MTGDGATPTRLIRGRYSLQHRLGGGAEGDVWLAHDSLIRRDVAIKLPRGDGDDLLAEARLIASLRHPHILRVLDAGHDDDGTAFVVTELMPGRTLAERIRVRPGSRVPMRRALEWTTQIAAALHAVHLAGRAHRDVKPINILLDGDDNAVLADFGIAIDVASQAPGSSVGTAAYKSPEQLAGEKLDARSDVYSLALVAHEMLAGRLPFTNLDDPAAIEREIAAGIDKQVSRQVPARLRPVIRMALARLPADRHESAPQFARELARAWRRSLIGRGIAAAGVLVLAGGLVLGWRIRAEQRRAQEAGARQMETARKAAREVMRVGDEAQHKVRDALDLSRRIQEQLRNDPFPEALRAQNEAIRKVEEAREQAQKAAAQATGE